MYLNNELMEGIRYLLVVSPPVCRLFPLKQMKTCVSISVPDAVIKRPFSIPKFWNTKHEIILSSFLYTSWLSPYSEFYKFGNCLEDIVELFSFP